MTAGFPAVAALPPVLIGASTKAYLGLAELTRWTDIVTAALTENGGDGSHDFFSNGTPYLCVPAPLLPLVGPRLVEAGLRPLGEKLFQHLQMAVDNVLRLTGQEQLFERHPVVRASISMRDTYLDPLHLLQVELLARSRQQAELSPAIEQAMLVTVAGIAAGLRNTG